MVQDIVFELNNIWSTDLEYLKPLLKNIKVWVWFTQHFGSHNVEIRQFWHLNSFSCIWFPWILSHKYIIFTGNSHQPSLAKWMIMAVRAGSSCRFQKWGMTFLSSCFLRSASMVPCKKWKSEYKTYTNKNNNKSRCLLLKNLQSTLWAIDICLTEGSGLLLNKGFLNTPKSLYVIFRE